MKINKNKTFFNGKLNNKLNMDGSFRSLKKIIIIF